MHSISDGTCTGTDPVHMDDFPRPCLVIVGCTTGLDVGDGVL